MSISYLLPARFREHLRGKGRKVIRTRGWGRSCELMDVYWGWQGYDIPWMAVVVFTGITQDQTGQYTTMDKDRAPKTLQSSWGATGSPCLLIDIFWAVVAKMLPPSQCTPLRPHADEKQSLKLVKAWPQEVCHSRGEWMERRGTCLG